MTKNFYVACILSVLALASLTACSTSTGDTQQVSATDTTTTAVEETTQTESAEQLTASDVLAYLQSKCDTIGNYVEYTEDSDINGQLGRPHQYTSKINMADTRIEQTDESDPIGLSIEVFATNADALARQEYINSIGQEMPTLVEYNYVNDYILLRVNKAITPTQAAEYEAALNDIFN